MQNDRLTDNRIMNVIQKLDMLLNGAPENAGKAAPRTVIEGPHPRPGKSIYEGANARTGPPVPLTKQQAAELKMTFIEIPLDVLASVPFPSNETLAAIGQAIRGKFAVGKEASQRLAAIDDRWMRLNAALVDLLKVTPNQRYRQHIADLAKRVGDGETTASEGDAWTSTDFAEDQSEKQRAFRRDMRALELEAWALCEPAYREAAVAVDEVADQIEAQERAAAGQWAVPYTRPSDILLRIRKAAHLLRTANHSGVGRPATMLEFLPR